MKCLKSAFLFVVSILVGAFAVFGFVEFVQHIKADHAAEVVTTDSTCPAGTMQVHVLKVMSNTVWPVNLKSGSAMSIKAVGNDGKMYSVVIMSPTGEPLQKGDKILVAYVGQPLPNTGSQVERFQFVRRVSKETPLSYCMLPWQARVMKNGSSYGEWSSEMRQDHIENYD